MWVHCFYRVNWFFHISLLVACYVWELFGLHIRIDMWVSYGVDIWVTYVGCLWVLFSVCCNRIVHPMLDGYMRGLFERDKRGSYLGMLLEGYICGAYVYLFARHLFCRTDGSQTNLGEFGVGFWWKFGCPSDLLPWMIFRLATCSIEQTARRKGRCTICGCFGIWADEKWRKYGVCGCFGESGRA